MGISRYGKNNVPKKSQTQSCPATLHFGASSAPHQPPTTHAEPTSGSLELPHSAPFNHLPELLSEITFRFECMSRVNSVSPYRW